MLDLNEMQFELLQSEDSSDGYGFGIGMEVSVDEDGFDPGELSWVTQDGQNTQNGITLFGRDVPTGRTWGFGLHVNTTDTRSALAALGRLSTAWRGQGVVDRPSEVLPLRYRVGDRVRRVYGRPRRLAAPPNNLILGGYVPVTADFAVVDSLHYSDELHTTTLGWGQDSDGGFVLPTTLPITTLPGSNQTGLIAVGGDVPAYPVIRFEGPVTNPYLQGPDWTLRLNMSLTATDYVEIDTRPWRMTVLLNGTTNVAGKLGRRQWLEDVRLKPGNLEVIFGGASSGGGASCAVSWRSAHTSL